MKPRSGRNIQGFTLIELLIVLGMLGTIMAGVYGVYEAHQRSAYTQDEVVEVQQNLRVAMDAIARDIRNVGVMMPGGMPAINFVGSNSGVNGTDKLVLNTASVSGSYAVIVPAPGTTANVFATNTKVFNVATSEMVDKFQKDDKVKIFRVGSNTTEPPSTTTSGGNFSVLYTDRVQKQITIGTSGVTQPYHSGDIIAETRRDARPETISYCLGPSAQCQIGATQCPQNQTCLVRIENEGDAATSLTSVVASNITDLQFTYLMKNNSPETTIPTDLAQVRAIRVRLVGKTVLTGSRQRELMTIVSLRNAADN